MGTIAQGARGYSGGMRPPSFLAALLIAATTTSALAEPRVISNLSDGALMGELRSTAQLQNEFTNNAPLLADATVRLGLTSEDFAAVRRAVINGGARYVELPRHLDGMSGERNGRAFAVHDVVIPAGVYGWEVDLAKPSELVRVFVPNRCGNISFVRVPRRQIVAAAEPYRVAPEPTPQPVIAQADAVPVVMPTPEVVADVAPASVAVAPIAPVAATAAHHFALLPFLLSAAAVGLLSSHHTTSTAPNAPAIVKIPTPVVTVCPPAAPGH